MLTVEKKSQRSTMMEMQVRAIISDLRECDSLSIFINCFKSECGKLKRISTAQASLSYTAKEVGDHVEVWHNTAKPRLIAIISESKTHNL